MPVAGRRCCGLADALTIDVAYARADFALRVDVALPLDGCTAVFGPSGSGKTTLLRLLAGFEAVGRGRIALGEEVLTDTTTGVRVAAHRRGIGTVFQEPALFDHLTVAGNLAYAERRAPARPASYDRDAVIAACELGGLLGRRPAALSGGERQRVSLARLLLARPRLALLDEPLSALDRHRRIELGQLIARLPGEFGVPVLLVSHDVEEVARIAQTVVTLADGHVERVGPTAAVLNTAGGDPAEQMTVLDGVVRSIDQRLALARIDAAGVELELPRDGAPDVGQAVRVRIRARDVAIATERPHALSIRNVIAGHIGHVTPVPDSAFATVHLVADGIELPARITRAAVEALSLAPGRAAYALVKSAGLE